ncbi:MAG: hypothetical protein EBY21_00665 [Alphaproteobacteria bacterium]|nr:hypothetical protein [Alphaproteobacteria bacterium]
MATALQVSCLAAEEDGLTVFIGPSLLKTYQSVAPQFETLSKAEVNSDETPRTIKAFCEAPREDQKLLIISRKLSLNEMRNCEKEEARMVGLQLSQYLIAPASNSSSLAFDLDAKTFYLAIAEEVPRSAIAASNLPSRKRSELLNSTADALIHNPFVTWRDIDASLPNIEINLLVPDGGTAKIIVDKRLLEAGCRGFNEIKRIFVAEARIRTCTQYRADDHVVFTDGALFLDSRMDLLLAKKPTIGFIRYPELLGGGVTPLKLNGTTPLDLKFNAKKYPASESISIYFFTQAVFGKGPSQEATPTGSSLAELLSEEMIGPEGAFQKGGFFPLNQKERNDLRAILRTVRGLGAVGVN